MVRIKFTLALVASASLAALASAQTFNLADDFSTAGTNPNGVWTYGSIIGGSFTPMTTTGAFSLGPYWIDTQGGAIWKNNSTVRAYGIEPGQISLDADVTSPVARFSAPYEGTFSILLEMGGTTLSENGGYGNVGVGNTGLRIDGAENTSFTYNAATNVRTWSISGLDLSAGETVDAYVNLVGNGGNLQAKFNVVGSPVPEPATMAALGLGAAALLRRRSRRA